MPDIDNCYSRKRCRVGPGQGARKRAEKQPEKQSKQLFFGCSDVLLAVFRLFYRDPLGTLFGCFPAVFNVGHLAPLQMAAEIARLAAAMCLAKMARKLS